MIDIEKLKLLIFSKNLSQRKVAKALGLTEKTFYEKMKKGKFYNNEIEAMIDLLEIEEPMKIFFTKK